MSIFWDKCKKIFIQEGIFIIILILPIFLPSNLIELIKKVVNAFEWVNINVETTGIISKIILIIFIYIGIIKFNKEREFFNGDIYGNIPMVFYYIAKFLGYSKVSLIRKPYDIQFKLLRKDLFELVADDISEDKNVNVEVNTTKFNYSKNLRECNLIIEDTYPIKDEQIPENKRELDTIRITKEKTSESIRVYSPKLVAKVSEQVELIQSTGAKINLFLTTNTKHTERIIKDVFMKAERNKYNLEVFLQEANGSWNFRRKGKKV